MLCVWAPAAAIVRWLSVIGEKAENEHNLYTERKEE